MRDTVKTALFVAIIVVAIFGARIIRDNSYRWTDTTPTISSSGSVDTAQGATVIIEASTIGAANADAWGELTTLSAAGDSKGVRQLIVAGQALYFEHEAQARVLENKIERVKIRVLSGPNEGRSGWVARSVIDSREY